MLILPNVVILNVDEECFIKGQQTTFCSGEQIFCWSSCRCWPPEDEQGRSDPDLWSSRWYSPLQQHERKVRPCGSWERPSFLHFLRDIAVLAVAAHIFQVYSAPSDHLCVSAAGQNSISHQACGWRRYVHDRNDVLVPVMDPSPQELLILLCSLPGSLPWRVDPVGPVWEDRCTLQHLSTANYAHLPTTPQRDPHISLWWGTNTRLSPPESHRWRLAFVWRAKITSNKLSNNRNLHLF